MPELKVKGSLSKADVQRLPIYEREHYYRHLIRETLQENPNGATAKQLSQALELDSRTVEKHLKVMVHTNEIYTDSYNNTVVYFPNTRALHPISQSSFPLDDDTKIESFWLRNRLGDFIFVQTTKKDEYREDVASGLLIPIEKFPEFVEYLKTQLGELIKWK